MLNANGRKRVVIANVSPQVNNGAYRAKGAVEEEVTISADIFGDSHDVVAAAVLLKHKKDKQWKEYPMTFISNDHWEYAFVPDKTGIYEFRVIGWIDGFATWKQGLVKKHNAGQDITVELQIGAQLLNEAAGRITTKAPKTTLDKLAKELTGTKEPAEALLIATSDKLDKLMYAARDKDLVTSYPQTFEIEIERRKAAFSTWYELFPRSASAEPGKHGTFQDTIALLPRVSKMGFDTLYLPPIHPIGEEKRKGRNNSLTALPEDPGSPWAIGSRHGGHKAVHPELGTMKDFTKLVAEANKLGIEIAMDIAFQCAPDHPYVKEHPQWFKWRPDGTVQYAENPPKKYEDILPFNFETEDWQNLWNELKSVIEFWIDKGVNIFRIDNPHTKSFAFWQWVIGEIRAKNPDIIFLAEAFTRPRIMEQLAKGGFNQSYTYFTWRLTSKELQQYMTELTRESRHYFRPNFWPNTPDILPPHLTHGGEAAHLLRFILAATLSSNYGLYGPVYEFGYTEPMPGKEEYVDNEKYEIKHWDWDKYTRIREVITRVNKIRKENAALQSTWNISFAQTDNDQLISYIKRDKATGNTLIIIVNLDPHNVQSGRTDILTEKLGMETGQAFEVEDLLSGDTYNWQHGWNYVSLSPAMPAHILKLKNNNTI